MKFSFSMLIMLTLLSACSDRLDHLGREPSFGPFSRDPRMPPRNPSTDQQPAAQIVDRSYPSDRAAGLKQHHAMMERAVAQTRSHQPERLTASRGSLWSSDPHSLFGDRRAKKVGDILTVVINIDDQAEISNATSRQRAGDESMSAKALFGFESVVADILPDGTGLDPGVSTTSSSAASGQGQVSRNEAISLKIAARVIEILPSGDLVITGRQEVRVNFELRDLQVVGIIRPEDITRNNDITYDKMAEAKISYGGRGHLSDVQQARYGQQVLDMISPF